MNRHSHNHNQGFSLVELLIYIALSAITTTAIFQVFIVVSNSFQHQYQIADINQDLRAAMNYLTNDLRNSCYSGRHDKAKYSSPKIGIQTTHTNATSIYFVQDLNEDLDTLDENERIRYYQSGSTLIKKNMVTNETIVISDKITSLDFKYYDENLTQITNPSDYDKIRSILITLEGKTTGSALLKRKIEKTLVSGLRIRNAGL